MSSASVQFGHTHQPCVVNRPAENSRRDTVGEFGRGITMGRDVAMFPPSSRRPYPLRSMSIRASGRAEESVVRTRRRLWADVLGLCAVAAAAGLLVVACGGQPESPAPSYATTPPPPAASTAAIPPTNSTGIPHETQETYVKGPQPTSGPTTHQPTVQEPTVSREPTSDIPTTGPDPSPTVSDATTATRAPNEPR
jgi:hypothetical protein